VSFPGFGLPTVEAVGGRREIVLDVFGLDFND
jgi:hypothetical protein